MTADLGAAIREAASRRPGAPAILTPTHVADHARFSLAVARMAAALAEAGIGPKDPVGLVATDEPADLTALFALFRLGAPVLVLGSQEALADRRELMRRVGARRMIGAPARPEEASAGNIPYDALAAGGDPARLPEPPHPETVAYFNRSSGTMLGQIKLVGITHAQHVSREATLAAGFPRGPADRHLHVMTVANSFARTAAMATLRAGGAVVFPPPLGSIDILRKVVREAGITITALSPPYVRDLLRATVQEKAPLLEGVRLLLGTAPLRPAELRMILQRITPRAHFGYSVNEAGYIAMAGPQDLVTHPASVGRTLPGVVLEAVDEARRPVAAGTPGELRVRHPDLPTGYVDPVPDSGSRFRDGWFYPGDAGTIAADGRITLLGRIDDVINVGGRKVHPTAIEAWLEAHSDVAEAAAVALPADRTGEMPIAAVVQRHPVEEQALIAFCRTQARGLPLPTRILAVPAIPRNAAGKVDRRALIAMLKVNLGR